MQYKTGELRFSARPGKEVSELNLSLKLLTITMIFLTQTCIVSFRRNSLPRSGGMNQRR